MKSPKMLIFLVILEILHYSYKPDTQLAWPNVVIIITYFKGYNLRLSALDTIYMYMYVPSLA